LRRKVEQAVLCSQRASPPDAIDRPVARGRDQPRARIFRRSVARPPLRGGRERLLGDLLGKVEVAEEANEGSEDAAPLVAEDLLDQR
jgi:hypothetical protein